ncbi:YihA family ribosome biogenesis GTP-binding protein [Commensalibacter sp. M0357]|uniref:ribosome biogenesis GTP-binding protein YihA/YsxC n=1 Tax=unclassified Commensalibacter TaxID=2630218 RepID=UPI0018DDB51E|nr:MULTISPECIES: ribosome biogenesis GTP-binding protein YihA/YsxC [unclassified Commensalibacter]MBI0074197.1 YihA family ribosome biogenesis GTP-binding protein [Commensalibacter sp. M0357]MBI0084039.1 YihA family ribosome biogenesis GTP-binding protein [Commensalibacter sp. M0355]
MFSKNGISTHQNDENAQFIEAGRLLFSREAKFFFGAQRLNQLEPSLLPEVAFAGRSNVGKSSLINALTGQKTLARASSEPGRTQQLNFFNIGGCLVFVDMPGYGYAKASQSVKKDWQKMMFSFLRGRPTLLRVMLLLDARIELKESDHQIMNLLDRAAVTFQIVMTKCDGLSSVQFSQKEQEIKDLIAKHTAAYPYIRFTSSQKNIGIQELRADLAQLI